MMEKKDKELLALIYFDLCAMDEKGLSQDNLYRLQLAKNNLKDFCRKLKIKPHGEDQ